jgi:hypothetical protein
MGKPTLGPGAWCCATTFHVLEVVEVTGHGKFAEP